MPTAVRRRRRRKVYATIVSLGLCCLLTVLLAVYYAGDIVRFAYLRKLSSTDPDQQQLAIGYIVRHRDDPAMIAAVTSRLETGDAHTFDAAVRGLAAAGIWGPQFGHGWVRYLIERAPQVSPAHRAGIAGAFARLLWQRSVGWDDPRIGPAVAKLMGDPDATVRLNALTAAACLPDGARRLALLKEAAGDTTPVIAEHARVMLKLIAGERLESAAAPPRPPADAIADVKRLADLESMPTGRAPIAVEDRMAPLLRIEAVRASSLATPEDLMRAFDADQPSLRDLATMVALERFTPAQCKAIALRLIGRFGDGERIAGVVLAGMLPKAEFEGEVEKAVSIRATSPGSWLVLQHCHLAMWMQGRGPANFDPASMLMNPKVARSTVAMALGYAGRLDGLDWMLNPLGESPLGGDEGLRIFFDTLRGWGVVHRLLPEAPAFWVWADAATQRRQVAAIRDWYLLNRGTLRFDPATRSFGKSGTNRQDAKSAKKNEPPMNTDEHG